MIVHEDNAQCISAVKSGYSGAMRHLNRVHRTCVGSMHELFFPCTIVDPLSGEHEEQPWLHCFVEYTPSSEHKGDFFTKVLPREAFERGRSRIGM